MSLESIATVLTGAASRRGILRAIAGALAFRAAAVEAGSRTETSETGAAPRRPFPQHLEYVTDTIRPNHRSQQQQDDDVRAAYDRWKRRYLVRVRGRRRGKPLYRVAFGKPKTRNHTRTVSEGQGYGMLIVGHLAGYDPQAQTIVDGLWRFARTHRSCIDDRLMRWTVPNRGRGCDNAFDGGLDIAYGLLLADAQWGDGDIDYRDAALSVIDGLRDSNIGPESHLPLLGDWVDPDRLDINQWTPRPSDFATGHFRAFGRVTGDSIWQVVRHACQDVVRTIQEEHSPLTGLLPDFVQPIATDDHTPRPADPNFLEGPHDGHYFYNAGRVPWRLGTDGLLGGDGAALGATATLSGWAEAAAGGDPHRIRAGYDLAGNPLPNSDYFSTFFAAPLGVAAMTVPSRQAWLNAIYDAVRDEPQDYYEDSVALLCLLVMTGNFWDPTV